MPNALSTDIYRSLLQRGEWVRSALYLLDCSCSSVHKLEFSVFKAHLFILLVNAFTKKEYLGKLNSKMYKANSFWKAAATLAGKDLVLKLILKIKNTQFGNRNVLCDIISLTTATPNSISH